MAATTGRTVIAPCPVLAKHRSRLGVERNAPLLMGLEVALG